MAKKPRVSGSPSVEDIGSELGSLSLPTGPDTLDDAADVGLLEARIDKLREEIEDLRSIRGLREDYGFWVYWFVVLWCVAVVVFLALQGTGKIHLETAVLTTLVGGTTVSIVGLIGFILQGLFKSK